MEHRTDSQQITLAKQKVDSSKGQIEDKCLGSLLLPLHPQREKRWAVTRNSAGKRNMVD